MDNRNSMAAALADTLLDDLDDLSDGDSDDDNDDGDVSDDEIPPDGNFDDGRSDLKPAAADKNDVDDGMDRPMDNDDVDDVGDKQATPRGMAGSIRSKGRLLESVALDKHMKAIRAHLVVRNTESEETSHYMQQQRHHHMSIGQAFSKEDQQKEYQLILQSNKWLALLQDELAQAHEQLKAVYQVKFQELEELLPHPVQYLKAVRVIGNEMDMTKIMPGLNDCLSNNQIITVSVAGSTTAGRPLTTEELSHVDRAASWMERILQVQEELRGFVQQCMEGLAPSVCALIGPSLASQLTGLAGGLDKLTKIPACNLQVLGQTKQNATSRAGLASSSVAVHQGMLMDCDLVQSCPKPLRTKALKAVAAKLALAARHDFINVETGRPRSAVAGQQFRQQVQDKLQKWQEPDKAPTQKALPKPDLTIKKRRGGKRMRRLKERFEETAMMKQANTRAFSAATGEYGDDAMGLTMGLLDTAAEDIAAVAGTNNKSSLRKVSEKRKMRLANTKLSRKRQAHMTAQATRARGGALSNPTNGLASSVVFTPTQGMELVNPDANKERVRQANRKWFNDNAGFVSALPKK